MPACDGELRLQGVSDLMTIQVRVGPSRIAGQGLFAAQAIPKGTRIIQYIGEKISSRERARRLAAGNAYIFHLTYRYAIDGQTLENTARYINHSCDPNCEVEKTPDTIWIVAVRDIAAARQASLPCRRDTHDDTRLPFFALRPISGWSILDVLLPQFHIGILAEMLDVLFDQRGQFSRFANRDPVIHRSKEAIAVRLKRATCNIDKLEDQHRRIVNAFP
jgi:hypothetical protein